MTLTRDDLVKAGSDALLRDGLDAMGNMGARALTARVLDAIGPMIRDYERANEKARIVKILETRHGYVHMFVPRVSDYDCCHIAKVLGILHREGTEQ